MSLQCRKSFEFENSKFSNCLPCAKKKHTAKCLVCRVPSCSTRRSGLFAVCPMRHTAKLSAVNLRRPSVHLRSPPPHVSGTCTRFAVCFEDGTTKIVICRVFGFCRVFLGLAHGKEAILPCAWGLPCVLFWAHGKVAVCRVPVF